MNNINEALNYIYSFMCKKNLHKNSFNHINNVKEILNILGYKQTFKIIHVTGTKGKGSTTLVLSNMLKSAGYKTASFVSPHIINVRERIAIDNQWISEEDFINITKKIKNILEENKIYNITVFEIFTIIGLYYFYIQNVDYACIEVGIGGKLDCTNIVDSSISIITSISYDHIEILGNTIEEITEHKAGIIKENSLVVSAAQEKESTNIIKKISKEKNSKLYVFKKDFDVDIISNTNKILEFNYIENEKKYKFETTLLGEHQSENISLAFKTFTLLINNEKLYYKAIDSIKNFSINARLTFVQRNPDIIIDGAHNSKSLFRILKTIYKWYDYLIILFAPLSEKDIKGMCEILKDSDSFIIVSSPNTNYKENDSYKTYQYLKERDNIIHIENFNEAIKYMQKLSKEKNIPALVIGSLYSASDYINLNI
ncbi:bifunctional folylpolyglutamate synthase/dihydrofolate synthase [Brachyspira aalborgi]|jgi:dihydrofolate synthase/folylpolyglutamate synthase|uniref:Dihydrofolate synthase/folylpolyglutamate synthase n=1 Tax=Brachyspira aalborgi TaxID=29522 RepID=A0A5C8E3G7_9SPIR|nr:Mur ligase family protein [Brachyspira aalborgi]TXJ32357.1 bifunctional folylpolyglutamate synthase/dihydrofolate synthase [Brachyspira aalborgi]TXJ40248.1 bifunctional folylpolyglutamate synthase/dihydrofolate synthase [Brachyspira aalborgi]TXJ55475.1 bifunctional folylpolyglutamate synthase/dihydrofolate synthase [Brachyspira aalborgi]